MTPMTHYLLISVAGLSVSSLLALRHACRQAPLMPPAHDYDLPAPPRRCPPPAYRARSRTDCQPEPATTKPLMEKLRREELRQRPLEGRN